MTSGPPAPPRPVRAARGLLAALVGLALLVAGILVGAVPAAAQNGVGASTPVMINTVGSPADIGAGQRLGKTVPQPQIVVATGVAANTGVSGADLLAGQADTLVSGDLTAAGRALAKHGGRPNSAFPAASGSQSAISDQAGSIVRDILDNQTRRVDFYNPRLKTQVVDIYDVTGRGIRYSKDGDFIGFLEPPR